MPSVSITRIALGVLRSPAGHVWIERAKPPSLGYWALPGGRIEPGESPLEAARREVLEETELVVEGGIHLAVLEERFEDAAGAPLYTVEVPCQMDMAPYRKMQKEFVLEFEGQTISAVTAAAAGQKLQQLAAGFVYDEQREAHWTHTVKLDRLAELLEENQRAPTIVFYQFQAEYDALRQRYPHAGTVDDIDLWNRGDLEVLLLHPAAAGHGLNLQHGGHHVVFLSLPWSLELYEQAIGRLHRSGQQHPVWCYVMLMEGTVDEKMWTALRNKRSVSNAALEALR